MNPEPNPCDGTDFGICGMPFFPPKRLKNSPNGLSGSMSLGSKPVTFVLPMTLILTTEPPAFSASTVKSGRREAAVGATATGAVTAARASVNGAPSNFM